MPEFSTGARVLWRPTRNATPHKKAAWSARMRTVSQNVRCRRAGMSASCRQGAVLALFLSTERGLGS